ncbi:MAG: glyoxalase [Ruminococcus sp.]|jgi:phage-related minor tail protein
MTQEYSEECLKIFLDNQEQLFDEPVAETMEEAEAFLEDCMAVVADSLDEVRDYMEESGMDVQDMTDEELEEASEVFPLPDGRYLIVEG